MTIFGNKKIISSNKMKNVTIGKSLSKHTAHVEGKVVQAWAF